MVSERSAKGLQYRSVIPQILSRLRLLDLLVCFIGSHVRPCSLSCLAGDLFSGFYRGSLSDVRSVLPGP